MKRTRFYHVMCLAAAITLVIPLLSLRAAEPKAGVKYAGIKEVRVLDGASSSASFIPYSARAKIINTIPGIRSSCIAGSMEGNVDALEKGQGDIIHSTNAIQWNVAHGVGSFKDKTYKNVAFLSFDEGYRPSVLFVRADSKIYTLQDLKGKHIATSTRGSGTAVGWTKMMAYHGITPENMAQSGGRFSYLSPGDVIQGMRDKTIDANMTSTGYYEANPSHLELIKTVGVRLIPLDPKAIEQFIKDNPTASKATVQPGLYNNKETYQTFAADTTTMLVRRDLPDDLVYDILKALYSKDGKKTFFDAYPTGIPFVLENGLCGTIKEIPVHPGAVKFFKDNGVVGCKQAVWPTSKEDALKRGGQWEWPWK